MQGGNHGRQENEQADRPGPDNQPPAESLGTQPMGGHADDEEHDADESASIESFPQRHDARAAEVEPTAPEQEASRTGGEFLFPANGSCHARSPGKISLSNGQGPGPSTGTRLTEWLPYRSQEKGSMAEESKARYMSSSAGWDRPGGRRGTLACPRRMRQGQGKHLCLPSQSFHPHATGLSLPRKVRASSGAAPRFAEDKRKQAGGFPTFRC